MLKLNSHITRANDAIKIVGLFGDPVAHSLSPAMHNAAFRKMGLNYTYLPFHVCRDALPHAVRAITALQMVGVNVTAPHKEAVVKMLHELSPDASLLNAVNTIKNIKGRLKGFNTDVEGFKYLLRHTPVNHCETVCLLGAGGAARAVALALCRIGTKKLIIANRTIKRAKHFVKKLDAAACAHGNIEVIPFERSEINAVLPGSLVINGLTVDPVETGIITAKEMGGIGAALDLRYHPQCSFFLQAAHAYGIPVGNGLHMLLGQGMEAFEIFTGIKAPVTEMQKVLFKDEGQQKNIFLTGFMGCGKSSTARILANMLNIKFIDSDELIAAALNSSIEEIFQSKGEEYFRQKEMEILKELGQKKGRSCVVATGGGAVLREENTVAMRENGIIIHLEVSIKEVIHRLQNTKNRPLLNVPKPQTTIRELMLQRAPYYGKADYSIKTDGKTPQQVAEEICKLICNCTALRDCFI